MELAKQALDVGLYTNRVDEVRRFYEDVAGLEYEELLKAGGGVHQHRYSLNGGVLKVNSARADLADAPTAFRRLVIASAQAAHADSADPDGTSVSIVAPGTGGVDAVAVHWAAPDPDELGGLLGHGLGATRVADDRWQVGTTVLAVEPAGDRSVDGPLFARGLRYLTVQVRDVRREHARLLDLGWVEARPPMKLGDVAFISFVKAPGGGWLEVSQRASLTGPLPGDA